MMQDEAFDAYMTPQGKWYNATVKRHGITVFVTDQLLWLQAIALNIEAVLVHYEGWGNEFDEWVYKTSENMQVLHPYQTPEISFLSV